LTPPLQSSLDYYYAVVLGVAYLAAGLAGLLVAPRDVRARTFLAFAIVSAAFGFLPVAGFDRRTIVLAICLAAVGSVALFHFAMVFPWRRPWFRERSWWMPALYVLPPAAVLALDWYAPARAEDLAIVDLLVLAAGAVPLLLVVAVALPLASIVALYRNVTRARRHGVRAAYIPALGILVSELGGGLLASVLGALLPFIGVRGAAVGAVTLLVSTLNLLAPLSFAAGVWHYGVLSLDMDEREAG
jgi:hypothetical protein